VTDDATTLDPQAVAIRCVEDWGIRPDAVAANTGGMNSRTWIVEAGPDRYVAKAVPAGRRGSFETGLRIASIVDAAGIPAGAPVRTRSGHIVMEGSGFALALLRFVEGAELTAGTSEELGLIGTTLGRAHRALAGATVPTTTPFPWLNPAAGHSALRSWIRPAIEAALSGWEAVGPATLTWGPLHTDPAPEAFRCDARAGVCGLIDWDLGVVGPLLYDLASAEMYVGGPGRSAPLIRAYLATGALGAAEVDRALAAHARLRWAVQADYFASRIAGDDLTGIGDRAENETGLEDARRALGG
jgi:homoserine kinase type II